MGESNDGKERDPNGVVVEPQKKKKRGEGKMPSGPSTEELGGGGRALNPF